MTRSAKSESPRPSSRNPTDADPPSVIALSKLYSLNDSRVAQTMVKGELIIANTDRIMTRSRAKLSTPAHQPPHAQSATYHSPPDPDRYTIIPAPLKILKVLIEELVSASGIGNAASVAAAAATELADEDDDGDNEGWEDEPDDTLDLALGSTKLDLMGWLEGGGSSRQRDDETQAYLIDFFVRADSENIAGFQNWCGMLTDDEKRKVKESAQ